MQQVVAADAEAVAIAGGIAGPVALKIESADIPHKTEAGVVRLGLATAETVVLHYEDVGRHNAVDKCVGRALTEGLDCSRLILLSTGRVSSDLAHKAARAGIPIVASLNSATTLALDVARQAGLTVVGRAGAHKPHIHTGPQRLRPQ